LIFSWTTRSEDRKYDNVQRLIVRCIYLNNIEMETNFKWLVYKTTNKKSGKYYIGISYEDPNNIDKEFLGSGIYKNDPYTYQYSKTPLQWAVKTDGVNNFDRAIISIQSDFYTAKYIFDTFINKESLKDRNIYNNFIWEDITGFVWFRVENGTYLNNLIIVADESIYDYIESYLSGNSFKDKITNTYMYAMHNYILPNKNGEIKYDHCRKQYIQNRPVFKYNGKTGEFIESYNTQTEAEKANKYSNITKSIKLKTPDKNGFMWAIFKTDYYNIPDEKTIKLIERRERNQAKFAISKAKRRERLGLKPRKLIK